MDGAQGGHLDAGDVRQLDDRRQQYVQFERLAALQVLESGGAVVADALGAASRRSMETPTSQPSASATASVSVIMISMTLRVPPCRHICRIVARASALIGLKEMLPSSLSQMSLRRSRSTGHLRPPPSWPR